MWQLFQHEFVQNAFLAGTIVAVLAGVVGYFIVLRAQAFATHALSHIGFAGATGAALIGVSSLLGTLVFTIVAAFSMGLLGKKIQGRDVEIGMVLAFALGLGVLFLRLYTSFSTETVSVLFGSILSVTRGDIMMILIMSGVVLLLLGFFYRPLLFASVDPEVAEARGLPVQFLSVIFMVLLGVTVAETVQVIGILLVFALLIVPAATAMHISNRPGRTVLLSVLLSLIFTWGGLLLSLSGHFPVSFYISTIAGVSYFIVVTLRHFIEPHRHTELPHAH